MVSSSSRRLATFTRLALVMWAVQLAGCATLPSSGPTGTQITRGAADPRSSVPIRVVEVTDLAALPPSAAPHASAFAEGTAQPTDLVGPGDVLDIAIYEAGVTLFGSSAGATEAGGFNPSSRAEKLPPNRVDDDGNVQLPYVGRLHVAGKTPREIERLIRGDLSGFSQNPQVLVSIRENITNTVIVGGEVGKPGRLVLATNREAVPDVIALAGGYRGEAKDLSVQILRGGEDLTLRLSDVMTGADRNLRIYPGDRVSVLRAPRSFSVMGAPGRVDLLPFGAGSVSLSEAIATAGGANPNLGDPKAIFVFRIEPGEDGAEQNVVYHINMMQAGSYFIAQRFAMRDKDILYFGNARANQPTKLVQLISQLFAPIVTVTSGIRTVQ